MTLSVSLVDPALAVDPGAFVRTEVKVRNASSSPERVSIRVTGSASKWSWVVPPELDVGANSEAVLSLGFRLPRGPEPAAGEFDFELVAAGEAGAEATAAGVLTVNPFHHLTVELDPPDARSTDPTEHLVVLENLGNAAVTTALVASSENQALEVVLGSDVVEVHPGKRTRVSLSLQADDGPLLQGRTLPYAVVATPEGGEPVSLTGELDQPARFAGGGGGAGLAVAIIGLVLLTLGLRLTVFAPNDSPSTAVAAGSTKTTTTPASATSGTTAVASHDHGGDCPATDHKDTRATGLTPADIPTLPPDYSFFQVAADGCSPVRWNPCQPIHFIINPANAPPTGVADVREAFKRLAKATGMSYVDDGLTDEQGVGVDRSYQPDRYGDRWAPILVHWMANTRIENDIQVAGGGFPTKVGDVYVSGNLFLNPSLITNKETRTTVAGGFTDQLTIGAIGSEGVTWGRLILHELGHMTGLGHVREPGQLMFPETSEQTGRTGFQAGDMAGLKLMGKDAGCIEEPKPAAGSGGRQGGGGLGRN